MRTSYYVPLPELSLADYALDSANDKLMQAPDRMALVAAKLALQDAGFSLECDRGRVGTNAPEDTTVLLGVGLSSMQAAFESYLCQVLPRDVIESALPEQRLVYNRFVVPKTMPNSPAAWVAITFGLHGPCTTLNASCASGTYALGEAFRRLRHGYAQVALSGGVEALCDPSGMMMRGFDTLGVLTRSATGEPQPFSRNRSGFLFAEGGACVLVLETLEHARGRKAPIYAEILDYRANTDGHHIVQADPVGARVIPLLRELSAGRQIHYLNAHGTGTVANDDLEAQAIQTVFGAPDQQPYVNSTKGLLGHTIGASGAFEGAVTALSLARGTVHPNLVDDPVPELNLPLKPVYAPLEHAISVSYGFGGHNAGVLFAAYHGD